METKEILDGFKAAKELLDLFKEAGDKLVPIQELFVKAIRDNYPQGWVEGVAQIADMDVDTAQGGLIVAMGVLAKIRVGLEGTECYDKVKELFEPKVS